MKAERKLESQFERKREIIEFHIANPKDYIGFQTMLKNLGPEEYEVKIIAGPSKYILPAIIRRNITGPLGFSEGREYFGEKYVLEGLNMINSNAKYRSRGVAKN